MRKQQKVGLNTFLKKKLKLKNKAIFFDKDGVLNVDKKNVKDLCELEFLPDAGNVIAFFIDKGFKIFIVTNQTVIARGIITEESLHRQLKEFQLMLLEQNKKAIVDKIYYCPHHPNANVLEYRKICECRKPKPGMLLLVSKEYSIDFKKSYMVGDRISDIIAGYLAGCKTIQYKTEKYNEPMIETDLKVPKEIKPDFTIMNLSELKEVIL